MADEAFCYVTTRGRRTGRPHQIEIWFGQRDGTLYVLSGGGDRSDWVRNLLADPRVEVRVGDRARPAVGRVVEDPAEEAEARHLLAAKYQGWREGRPLSTWARTALPVALDPAPTVTMFTIGHGARDAETFLELLRGAGVRRVVDVRTAPGSRKHPQFGRDALTATLTHTGIDYVWEGEALGGWRRARPDSRHTALRSPGFRGYADHMETEVFGAARDRLIASSREIPTAVMCAESLWWRCHRRMLADALVAAGCEVRHIMDGGRL
ncbi:MAG: nitroreductase family deazaflavin-dependent oxidoreductase, partial [Actinomycetota bacterium]